MTKRRITSDTDNIDSFTVNELGAMEAEPNYYEAAMILSAMRHDPRQLKLDLPKGRIRHRPTMNIIG